ncbi:hypothetical protein DFH06DRAFT_1172643 [Mycena polygramma]|nr:hypothetical protein DFH06DRAFT_1172643 [Mycena polygramma]
MTAVPVSHRFVRYRLAPNGIPKIGLVDIDESNVVEVLGYTDLFKLIEAHPNLSADYQFETGETSSLNGVEILAPLPGRDVLCVGKNYIAHAAEFHKSGFDSSDKNEQPDFPVLFTKRATSIIPTRKPIYTHPNGELGIIIGKAGLAIPRENGWDHVWGAVIINDGPYVVPSSSLSFDLLHLTTKVNGEIRQSQNTSELIFDVPTLIETASMGISVQPGDIIATGTPVGVGMGMSPKVWLKDGDVVEISIPPLGTLSNPVTSTSPGLCSLSAQ